MTVTNTAIPVVTGVAQVGHTLTTDNGSWTFDLAYLTYTYQWLRCDAAGANCVDIGGATNSTYLITTADIGSTIRSEVTATENQPNPPPAGGDPYFDWIGTGGKYNPLSTVFAAYHSDPQPYRIADWGGLPVTSYDTAYLGGSVMSTETALRVHLQAAPTNPNGSSYTSRQEVKQSDPPWNIAYGGSNYDKASIRNLTSQTLNQNFAFGLIRWFAWDYFFPLNYGGDNDSFNWPLSGWYTLMDIHGNGNNYQQNWNVLESQVDPLTTNNAWHSYHIGAHEGTSDPAPYDRTFIHLDQLSDGSGNRVTGSYNVWHELVVGVKLGYSGSGGGWVELWHDGVQVLAQTARDTVFSNETGCWLQAQNYKQHTASLLGGATRSVIYYGGIRAGLTRGDVQRM